MLDLRFLELFYLGECIHMITRTLFSSVRISVARLIFIGLFLSLLPMKAIYADPEGVAAVSDNGLQVTIKPQVVAPQSLASAILKDAHTRDFPGFADERFILDQNAKKELQLDWLIKQLDRTQTYLGSNSLAQLMNPVNDLAEIQRRQSLIKIFMNDMSLYNSVARVLQAVAENEEQVLTYWNRLDPLLWSVEHLYFNFGPFKNLNQSKVALEAITLYDAGTAFKALLGFLCLQGFYNEVRNLFFSGVKPDGKRIWDGVWRLPNNHNFLWTNYMHDYVPGCDDAAHKNTVINVSIGGTFKDAVLLQNEIWRRQGNVLGSFTQPIKNFFSGTKEPVAQEQGATESQAAAAANAEEVNALKPEQSEAQRPHFSWGTAALLTAGVLYEDYEILKAVRGSKAVLKQTNENLEALRARMIGVADFMKAIQQLEALVVTHSDLRDALPAHVINNIALSQSLSEKMQELVALLNTATFKKSKSIFYLRGKVLYANKLFQEIKEELIPAMQAMAEIDAYCSIARLMKESALNANKFTFVTFTNAPSAYLELTNCWIPVLNPNEAVANSMTLGQKNPGKLIITGPNGGGKSTHLKAVGQTVALAQSWGIVPARRAQMSIFDAVRTSMDPREDLAHGLSKFMAQKESMDKIQEFVLGDPSKISLILLDEPYDGTVTDEIARRAGAFCDNVVTSKNCLAIVATHIMPTLSNEKLYAWAHVDIAEPKAGTFRRTFKLRSGLAKRWFEDPLWRSRFIDWLSVEMRNKARANLA